MEYVAGRGADYLVRLRSDAFKLYDGDGREVEIWKRIRRMDGAAYKVMDLHYKSEGELRPVRICVYRKTEAQMEKSERKRFYDHYVIVATSLMESAERILELYRLRWQIETLFKRLKSIFGLDEMKAKTDGGVKLWFYCKLLLAAICETLDNMGRFSPCAQLSLGPGQQVE